MRHGNLGRFVRGRKPKFHGCGAPSSVIYLWLQFWDLFPSFLSFVNKLTDVSSHWWKQFGIYAWLCMLLQNLGIAWSFTSPYPQRWAITITPCLWMGTETKLILCQHTWILISQVAVEGPTPFPSFVCFYSSWTAGLKMCHCPLALKSSALPFPEGSFVLLRIKEGIRRKWITNPKCILWVGEHNIFIW